MKCVTKVFAILLLVEITAELVIKENPPNEILDHRGKSFLLGFLEMSTFVGTSTIYITSREHGELKLFVPFLNLTKVSSIMPGTSIKFELQKQVRMMGFRKERKGITLTSNVSVSVYATNVRSDSRDVHVVFPISTLGTEHVIACFTPRNEALIGIIATTDDTLVQIQLKLPRASSLFYLNKTYRSGDVLRIFLNKLQTFQVKHGSDLTGTTVISSSPVVILSGNICASVPTSEATCSHIAAQIPPLSKWGKRFITAPIHDREKDDIFRIVSGFNATNISILGKVNFTLNAGEFKQFELGSKEHSFIICSKPSMLVQFNKGPLEGLHSGAFSLVVPPIEQYTSRYDLVIPVPRNTIFKKFVYVIAETVELSSILFNSTLFHTSFTWNAIPGTNYSHGSAQLSLSSTDSMSVSLSNASNDVRFAVYAVGHRDEDGYGYVGGMAMTDINCKRWFKMEPGDGIDNDCDGRTDEERENGLDDDHDSKIDEDLDYVVQACNFTHVLKMNKNTRNFFLHGSYHNSSISLGDCEGTIVNSWYINSPNGIAITLATQKIKWIKPKINISFPSEVIIDRSNISVFEDMILQLKSLCPVDDANITVTYSNISIKGDTTLIRRMWTVREICGRTASFNQTIINNTAAGETVNKSRADLALYLATGVGVSVLVIVVLFIATRVWRKHVARQMTVSARIDVLEAVEQQWHYTNTTATEDATDRNI